MYQSILTVTSLTLFLLAVLKFVCVSSGLFTLYAATTCCYAAQRTLPSPLPSSYAVILLAEGGPQLTAGSAESLGPRGCQLPLQATFT
ncbi:hypothetical protein QBC43DRAFT_312044 [Cladorrhinum sp. PSN259]|nr:hypothetical protein QBC43DRAFT_312044 [Cladorrhinum sp. PSN259]